MEHESFCHVHGGGGTHRHMEVENFRIWGSISHWLTLEVCAQCRNIIKLVQYKNLIEKTHTYKVKKRGSSNFAKKCIFFRNCMLLLEILDCTEVWSHIALPFVHSSSIITKSSDCSSGIGKMINFESTVNNTFFRYFYSCCYHGHLKNCSQSF